MKKNIIHYVIIASILLFGLFTTVSCEFEGSHNGELDGFWMLTKVDTLSNGQSTPCREKKLFWSFQADLMKTQDLSRGIGSDVFFYRFNKENGKLRVYDAQIYDRMNGNKLLEEEDVYLLHQFGIHSVDETFIIDKLNGKELQLSSALIRLSFEKY